MKSADGKTVDLDSMSPEELHFGFGETWRVKIDDSEFLYSGGETFYTYYQPQFRPVFEMPAESSPLAKKLCGANKVFLRFPIFVVKLECLLHKEKIIDSKMT